MSEGTKEFVISKLKELNDAELKYLFGELLDYVETTDSPTITDEVIQEQNQEDEQFLRQVAVALNVESKPLLNDRDGAINFLTVITEIFPEYANLLKQEIMQLEQLDTTLGPGSNRWVASILVIAIATSIVRPNVEFERSITTTAGGETKEMVKVKVEGTGIDDIAEVLKAALPFVSSK
jgi:hypothetical protein